MPPKRKLDGRPWPIADLNTVVDIHKYLPKHLQVKPTHYALENELGIKLPNNSLFCGQTQSGKTKTAFDLLVKMDSFDFIIICAKDPGEQLYQGLIHILNKYAEKKRLPASEVYQVCTNLRELPDVDKMSTDKLTLALIDDMITEKESSLKVAADYTVRGLKKKLTTWFFTQSYFESPKLLRDNIQYLFLFKVVSEADMKNILRAVPSNIPREVLMDAFDRAFAAGNFITIDTKALGPGKFRLNYNLPLFSAYPRDMKKAAPELKEEESDDDSDSDSADEAPNRIKRRAK